jgi:hypothetical protein
MIACIPTLRGFRVPFRRQRPTKAVSLIPIPEVGLEWSNSTATGKNEAPVATDEEFPVKNLSHSRRDFLKTTSASLAAGSMPYWFTSTSAQAFDFKSANERPVVGCIGTGSRWGQIVRQAGKYGDIVAVCDVDSQHAGKGHDLVQKLQSEKGNNAEITARCSTAMISTSSRS